MKAMRKESYLLQYWTSSSKSNFYTFSIFALLQQLDLRNYLSKKRSLTESEALKIFGQIVEGFKELCKNGIIHRDLKPANILLSNGVYKIADFGFARSIGGVGAKTHCGTEKYMAPEIISNSYYGISVDIWALGVLFYFMLFAEYPFKGTLVIKKVMT